MTRDELIEKFGPGADWDAAAHVRVLRQNGGASSGYTADLIQNLHCAVTALTAAFEAEQPVASEWHRVDRPGTGSVRLYTLREEGYRRGEPVMVNDVMINIDRGSGSTTDIEPIVQRIRSALADAPVAIPTANCCVCGRIIDTREKSAGGDDHGDETAPGKWTCSIQCYDAFTGYVEEPAAWYRDESFTQFFSLSPVRPTNATSNPDEWKPLYAHPLPSGAGDNDTIERVSTEAAMSQWERSIKRPDLSEKDRVRGAIEAYKRQAFAFAMLSPTRTASSADGSAISTSGAYPSRALEKETRDG